MATALGGLATPPGTWFPNQSTHCLTHLAKLTCSGILDKKNVCLSSLLHS